MTASSIATTAGQLEWAAWGERAGGACPILLLHEGLGSVRMWKAFPEQLAEVTGRRVVAFSRPGHGWSEGIGIPHRPDYMHEAAELLPEIHVLLGIERAHWLGHSDGGSIALIGAARHKHLAASLILEAPHVYVEDETVSSIAEITNVFSASDMGERMKRYHAEPVRLFDRWSRIWLDPDFRAWNIEYLLPSIKAPVLLIQGQDDQYGTMDQLDRIAAILPDTARFELENCRHSPHFDRTEAVLAAVAEFLQEKE